MTGAGKSVVVYGIYLVALGAFAMLCPGALLDLFGLAEPAEDTWIRVAGWLTTALGLYYLSAAWREIAAFYLVTVLVRAVAVLALILLVAIAKAPAQLLILALVDGVGALITLRLLSREARSAAAKAPEIASNPG
jgi:hypothetical protein